VWLPQGDLHVAEVETIDPSRKKPEIEGAEVLCDDKSGRTEQSREANGVVAAASTDVADRHARSEPQQASHLSGFVTLIARLLRRDARPHNLCHRPLGAWKGFGAYAGRSKIGNNPLSRCGCKASERDDDRRHHVADDSERYSARHWTSRN
jgi:hypothetical protein